MLWIFGIVVVLVSVLLTSNGRYALQCYAEKRSLVWLSVHFVFMFLLGYSLLFVTKRVLLIMQDIHQLEQAKQI